MRPPQPPGRYGRNDSGTSVCAAAWWKARVPWGLGIRRRFEQVTVAANLLGCELRVLSDSCWLVIMGLWVRVDLFWVNLAWLILV